jgi:hypothetical protein
MNTTQESNKPLAEPAFSDAPFPEAVEPLAPAQEDNQHEPSLREAVEVTKGNIENVASAFNDMLAAISEKCTELQSTLEAVSEDIQDR